MPRYVVKASAAFELEMSVEAATPLEAKELVTNQLMVSASLTDLPKDKYDVYEDSISGVERVSAVAE